MTTLADYRAAVIKTVPCPFCGAKIGQGCRKPARFMLRRTMTAVAYVHDDRSLAYDEQVLSPTIRAQADRLGKRT